MSEEATTTKKATGLKGLAVGRSDLYKFNIADVNVKEGLNSRTVDFDPTNEEDIALVKSIVVNGVKQPVSIYFEDGRIYLTNGHRRRAAMQYAVDQGLITLEDAVLPAVREAPDATPSDLIFSQITSNAGKAFTALEQAAVYKKLMGLGMSTDDIAAKAGISGQRVSDLLALGAAPAKVKRMVEKGEVSATLAITTQKKVKGDNTKLTEALTGAVKTAKKAGKTKATAKHVEKTAKPDVNPKARLRALFADIDIKESNGGYVAYMAADVYAEVRGLIGF